MKYLALIFSIFILIGCNENDQFHITGHVPNYTEGAVRLSQFGESRLDSKVCELDSGNFSFKGQISTPEQFILIYEKNGPTRTFQSFSFFMEPSANVDIVLYPDSIKESTISGSKIADRFLRIDKTIERDFNTPLYRLRSQYEEAVKNGNNTDQESIMAKADSINQEILKHKLTLIANNPKSYISAYLLHSLYFFEDTDTIQKYFKKLNLDLSDSKYYQRVQSFLSLLPGNPYEDFELTNGQGNTYKFSEIAKDKVVLIDFWASWCQPCRAQNQTLASFYKKYKSKGFEIVGISIDRDTTAFLNTIQEDSMTWINLLDRTDQEPIRKLYETGSIPSNILIDKNGIITHRDIGLDALENTINELLTR